MAGNDAYTAIGDVVMLRLTGVEYDRLLIMMGFAVGAAMKEDMGMAYRFVDLVNRLNKGNPAFKPYEIPDKFKSEEEPN
jgi:hypothetical protein